MIDLMSHHVKLQGSVVQLIKLSRDMHFSENKNKLANASNNQKNIVYATTHIITRLILAESCEAMMPELLYEVWKQTELRRRHNSP